MSVEQSPLTGILSPGDVRVSISIEPNRTIVTDENGTILACANHNGASLNLDNSYTPEKLSTIETSADESAITAAVLDTFGKLRGPNPHLLKGNIQEDVLPDGTVQLIFADGNNRFRLEGEIPENLTSQAVALAAGLVGAEKLAA